MNPQAITVAGEWLVVSDAGDSALKVFSRRSGRLTASTGRQGAGPGEFRNIWTIQARPSQGDSVSVWAFDSRLSRLTGFSISPAGKLTAQPPLIQLQQPGSPLSLQWISDSSLIEVGFLWRGRFSLIDHRGNAFRWLGVIPLAHETVLNFAAQQALQPSLAVHPSGREVAIAARYAARVDIYATESGELTAARVPLPFEPEMKSSALRGQGDTVTIFRSNDQTRFGYISITAVGDRIYALFSGRTRAETPGRANFGDQVHVFDWEGVFLNQIDLPRDTYQIAVDPNNSTLYGLTLDPEPTVYAMELSAVATAPMAPVQPSLQP